MENESSLFWEFKALKGMGPIQFLDSAEEIENYKSYLGNILISKTEQVDEAEQSLREAAKLFGFSDEDLAIALEAIRSSGSDREGILCKYFDSGLSMEFKDNKLIDLFADNRAKLLSFNGLPIFSSKPQDLIQHFINELQEIPVIKNQEIVFQHHCIYLYSFLEETKNGEVQDANPNERTINWRASERTNAVDTADYTALVLH